MTKSPGFTDRNVVRDSRSLGLRTLSAFSAFTEQLYCCAVLTIDESPVILCGKTDVNDANTVKSKR